MKDTRVKLNVCFAVFRHQRIFRVNIRVLTAFTEFDNTSLDTADDLLKYKQKSGVRFSLFSYSHVQFKLIITLVLRVGTSVNNNNWISNLCRDMLKLFRGLGCAILCD